VAQGPPADSVETLSYGLDFSPDAEEDLRSAYLWYESKRTGLGEEFLCCVEAALALVRDNPFLGRKVHERGGDPRAAYTGILYGSASAHRRFLRVPWPS
jgi:hypothetical protein